MPALLLYITHISLTDILTRLTSTLTRSGKCYKNGFHEKKAHVSTSAQLLHVHNVHNVV